MLDKIFSNYLVQNFRSLSRYRTNTHDDRSKENPNRYRSCSTLHHIYSRKNNTSQNRDRSISRDRYTSERNTISQQYIGSLFDNYKRDFRTSRSPYSFFRYPYRPDSRHGYFLFLKTVLFVYSAKPFEIVLYSTSNVFVVCSLF